MKQTVLMALLGAIALGLAACGPSEPPPDPDPIDEPGPMGDDVPNPLPEEEPGGEPEEDPVIPETPGEDNPLSPTGNGLP